MSLHALTAGAVRPRGLVIAAEIALFVALMALYEILRWLVAPSSAEAAREHARQVIDAERALGIYVEPEINAWLERTPAVEALTSQFYTLAHVIGFATFFAVLLVVAYHRYPFMRNWFWIANGLAVLVFWAWALAPPRLLGMGFTDPTKEALQLGGALGWFQRFRNEYAAMPSMHFGYSFLFALAVTLMPGPRWRMVIWLVPLATLFAIVATANHFWLDAVGGAVVVGAALGLTLLVSPGTLRPWEPRP